MINKDIAIIVIHGFCGSTNDILPLVNKLKDLGYDTYSPCLSGHTGDKKDLKNVTYNDWIKDIEDVYLQIEGNYKEIILVGFSMGGLISLQIAYKYKVKSVITLNTPIYLWNVNNALKYIYLDLKDLKVTCLKNYIMSINRFTVNAIINFRKLLKETKKILSEIDCDVLFNQAYGDETVRYKSVNFLHNKIKSQNKKIKLYDKSNHMILQSEVAEEIMGDIMDYITSIK